jgi:hypothetical protein
VVSITDHRAFPFRATLSTYDAVRLREIIRQDAYEGDLRPCSGQSASEPDHSSSQICRRFPALLHAHPNPLPQVVASQHGVPAIPQLGEIDLRGDVPATKSIASAHSLGSRQTSPPVAGKFRGLSRSARA